MAAAARPVSGMDSLILLGPADGRVHVEGGLFPLTDRQDFLIQEPEGYPNSSGQVHRLYISPIEPDARISELYQKAWNDHRVVVTRKVGQHFQLVLHKDSMPLRWDQMLPSERSAWKIEVLVMTVRGNFPLPKMEPDALNNNLYKILSSAFLPCRDSEECKETGESPILSFMRSLAPPAYSPSTTSEGYSDVLQPPPPYHTYSAAAAAAASTNAVTSAAAVAAVSTAETCAAPVRLPCLALAENRVPKGARARIMVTTASGHHLMKVEGALSKPGQSRSILKTAILTWKENVDPVIMRRLLNERRIVCVKNIGETESKNKRSILHVTVHEIWAGVREAVPKENQFVTVTEAEYVHLMQVTGVMAAPLPQSPPSYRPPECAPAAAAAATSAVPMPTASAPAAAATSALPARPRMVIESDFFEYGFARDRVYKVVDGRFLEKVEFPFPFTEAYQEQFYAIVRAKGRLGRIRDAIHDELQGYLVGDPRDAQFLHGDERLRKEGDALMMRLNEVLEADKKLVAQLAEIDAAAKAACASKVQVLKMPELVFVKELKLAFCMKGETRDISSFSYTEPDEIHGDQTVRYSGYQVVPLPGMEFLELKTIADLCKNYIERSVLRDRVEKAMKASSSCVVQ